jgi:hypothetical protein
MVSLDDEELGDAELTIEQLEWVVGGKSPDRLRMWYQQYIIWARETDDD